MKTAKKPFGIKAFTLMEILVTVIIVGALAGIAFPQFSLIIEKNKAQEGVQILRALHAAKLRYMIENNDQIPTNIDQLGIAIPRASHFDPPIYSSSGGGSFSILRSTGTYKLILGSSVVNPTCTHGSGPNSNIGMCFKLGFPVVA